MTHTVDCASRGILRVSITSLKKRGTWTFSSCKKKHTFNDNLAKRKKKGEKCVTNLLKRRRTTNLATDEQADAQDNTPSRFPIILRPYMHREPTNDGPITSTLLRICYDHFRLCRRRRRALARSRSSSGRLRSTLRLLREVTKWTPMTRDRQSLWKAMVEEYR
jgi:hypothetical protein